MKYDEVLQGITEREDSIILHFDGGRELTLEPFGVGRCNPTHYQYGSSFPEPGHPQEYYGMIIYYDAIGVELNAITLGGTREALLRMVSTLGSRRWGVPEELRSIPVE